MICVLALLRMLQSAAKRFLNVNVLTIRTASVEEPTTSALPGIATASKDLHLSQPAVTNAMESLEKLEIVKENSGRNWNRIYVYSKYLRIMTEGAELSSE